MKVPPKDSTVTEIGVTRMPHGWRVTTEIRSLERAVLPAGDDEKTFVFFLAWMGLSYALRDRGFDLRSAVDQLPDT